MAKKTGNGEVNKSAAIREILSQDPKTKASEVVSTLAAKGIKVRPGLVYFIKGKLKGKRRRRGQGKGEAAQVTAAPSNADVLGTIRKVKTLAAEVGGLRKLQALVEALGA
jgi:hypothetical protein